MQGQLSSWNLCTSEIKERNIHQVRFLYRWTNWSIVLGSSDVGVPAMCVTGHNASQGNTELRANQSQKPPTAGRARCSKQLLIRITAPVSHSWHNCTVFPEKDSHSVGYIKPSSTLLFQGPTLRQSCESGPKACCVADCSPTVQEQDKSGPGEDIGLLQGHFSVFSISVFHWYLSIPLELQWIYSSSNVTPGSWIWSFQQW